MSTKIKYTIEFHSEWHCGSGLSAGADLDALVIKDKDNLPYVPGKTLKGLIREGVETILTLRMSEAEKNDHSEDIEAIKVLANNKDFFFGQENTTPQKEDESHNPNEANQKMIAGKAFFSNAELPEKVKAAVKLMQSVNYLYNTVSATKIDQNGVADEHSLRSIETVIPCSVEGEIIILDDSLMNDDILDLFKQGMQFVKRLGVNRNRGLGRCTFKDIEIVRNNEQNQEVKA